MLKHEKYSNVSNINKMAFKLEWVKVFLYFSLLVIVSSSLSNHSCPPGWIHLSKSKKCFMLETVKRFFNHTEIKCSDYHLGRLASNLNALQVEDLFAFSEEVLGLVNEANPQVWTTNNTACFVGTIKSNTNVELNICEDEESERRIFFCETFSYDKDIGLQKSETLAGQIKASSFYTSSATFNLISHKAEFARLNNVFRTGIFSGKGWCSNSTSKDEFIQVDFDGTIELSGVQFQHGLVDGCELWVDTYTVEYLTDSSWIPMTQNGTAQIFDNDNSDSTTWFVTIVTCKAIRLKPLSTKTLCLSFPDVYCLRMEIFGRYLEINYNLEVAYNHDLVNCHNDCRKQSLWPSGGYGIITDCSNERENVTNGYNLVELSNVGEIYTSGEIPYISISNNYLKQNICLHYSTSGQGQGEFPKGSYCMLLNGDECPDGFSEGGFGFAEYYDGKYKDQEQLYHETNFKDITTKPYQSYCCRKDINDDDSTFDFMLEPFILYPTSENCEEFKNIKSRMEIITFNNNGFYSLALKGIIIPHVIWDASIIRQYICVYQPYNYAESLSLETSISKSIFATHVEFKLSINILRGEKFIINYGVDADGVVTLSGNLCPNSTLKVHLVRGTATVNLMVCEEGEMAIQGSMITSQGIELYSNVSLQFSEEFSKEYHDTVLINTWQTANALDFSDAKNISSHLQLDFISYENSLEIYEVLRTGIKVGSTLFKDSHCLIALFPADHIDLLTALSQGFNMPLLIFEPKFVQRTTVPTKTRHMTLSSTNSFTKALSTIPKNSNVIIIRMTNKVSIAEFYALYVHNMRIIEDIVLIDDVIEDHHIDVIKNNPGCRMFLFLNSKLSSLLLSKAIENDVTPYDGYTWYSFAPNYIMSNAYLREPCLSMIPPCYEKFDKLQNIFFQRANEHCPHALPITKMVEMSHVNLSTLIHEDLPLVATHDMVNLTASFVDLSRSRKISVSTESILEYIDSQDCLPSGSGLNFYPIELESSNTNTRICQPGWSSNLCDEPVCSSYSCNTSRGVCIAPETCWCLSGWYGRGCNYDCKLSCINGICNDGILGDGKCLECDWPYLGDDCAEKTLIYGFIAASIGTGIVGFFLAMYILRFLQTQEQTAEAEIEANEKDYSMTWENFEFIEDIDYSRKVTKKHLKKKLNYTTYKKGTTFSGQDAFVKCFQKPYFELSLSLKTELNKLCKINHGNIEPLLGILVDKPTVGIVTEAANMGSLYDVLHEKHIPITLDVRYSMMQDICRGMAYLHDIIKMEHGRLKSTNCVIHQGWLVKITDIGLKRIKHMTKEKKKIIGFGQSDDVKKRKPSVKRRRRGSIVIEDDDDDSTDYNSLLWTAPEYVSSGATSLDQVVRVTKPADIYSFGIIMSEIISRRPPFSECTVMSIPHIVQAVGHIKEMIVNLGQLNIKDLSTTAAENLEKMREGLLRPVVEDTLFPDDPVERSILRSLMDACWAEQPEERPPFAFSLEVLELITPLKGSQTLKRAVLLQRETESLEQYISHDTQEIFQEKNKFQDFLSRVLPVNIVEKICNEELVKPEIYNDVTVMVARICNFSEILNLCSPSQAVSVVDYIWRAMSVIISNRKLNIIEINSRGDYYVLGSGFPVQQEKHAVDVVTLATRLIEAAKTFKLPQFPLLKISLRIGIHTGSVTTGIITTYGTPNYIAVGDAMAYAKLLESECMPNYVHATKKTVMYLNGNDFDIISRSSYTIKVDKQPIKTYWVLEK